jgi:predicted nucleic acid-binding protein
VVDWLLAATALVHGLAVVTRNVRDFDDLGVPIVNPWSTG